MAVPLPDPLVPVHDEGAGQVLAARGAGAAPAEEVQAVGERGQGDLLSRVERPRADTLAEQATRTLDTGAAVGFELVGGDEELLPRVEADGYRLVPVHGQRAGAGPAGAGAGAAPGDDAGAGGGVEDDALPGVEGRGARARAVDAAGATDDAVGR